MKKKLGVIIVVLLTGIILGIAQPVMLYAGAETGGGTLWDPFVNLNPFKGKVAKLTGPLSIYYLPTELTPTCLDGNFHATMYYTVRLSSGSTIYTSEGVALGICLGDIGEPGSGGQGDLIMSFLGNVVNNIFPNAGGWLPQQGWNLTSVGSPGIGQTNTSYAFVADISIEVSQSKK